MEKQSENKKIMEKQSEKVLTEHEEFVQMLLKDLEKPSIFSDPYQLCSPEKLKLVYNYFSENCKYNIRLHIKDPDAPEFSVLHYYLNKVLHRGVDIKVLANKRGSGQFAKYLEEHKLLKVNELVSSNIPHFGIFDDERSILETKDCMVCRIKSRADGIYILSCSFDKLWNSPFAMFPES